MITALAKSLRRLWHIAPALTLSIFLLCGTAFGLYGNMIFLIIGLILPLPFILYSFDKELSPFVCSYCMLAVGVAFGCYSANTDLEKYDKTQALVLFFPKDLRVKSTHFASYYEYKGKILIEDPDSKSHKYIPAVIRHPKTFVRPAANSSYFLHAILEKGQGSFLNVKTLGPWKKQTGSFSLCEVRYKVRTSFKEHIYNAVKDKKVARFLFSLCTGEIETQMLSKDFSQLGLGHILAISGFHFGIIAAFFGKVTGKLLPRKLSLVALFLIMSLYFLFIGSSPSVFRAWTTISLVIAGKLFRKKVEPLNALGIALLCEVIFHPESISSSGFQLSFLCTFALLYIVPTIQNLWKMPCPSAENVLDRCILATISFTKKTAIVNLSVHATSILLCLYHFHTFPLLSLLYNLFFPSLTAASLCIFLIAELFFFIPPLSSLLMHCSTLFTAALLKLTEHPPLILHYELSVSTLSKELVILYLVTITTLCLILKQSQQQDRLSF